MKKLAIFITVFGCLQLSGHITNPAGLNETGKIVVK
jgi:hypothetical protein